jgi:hypothetical protein
MIDVIIKALQSDDYYGAGEYVELAKGKHEYTLKWYDVKRKIKRQWRSRNK